jgi:transcriptional regulator with XRE-family HTH domain
MQIGTTLQVLRKMKGYQQREICKKVGISQKHLSEIENGHKHPRWQVLVKLLTALGATLEVKATVTNAKETTQVITLPIEAK